MKTGNKEAGRTADYCNPPAFFMQMNCPKINSLLSIRQMPFYRPHFHSTSELAEADSVPAIQRRIPEFRLHLCRFGYLLFLRSHGTSFIASVARTSPFWRCCKGKIFPCVFASIVGRKMPRFRHLSGRYCTALLRLNQLRIRGIIQRDQCRLSKSLFLSADQATELKLMKDPCCALPTAMQFLLCLFHSEVNPDGAVSFKKTVDF